MSLHSVGVPHPSYRSRFLLLGALLLIGGGVYACRQAGQFLASDDPLTKADAIVVLAGTLMERPLEAADLYREGYAPVIVFTRETLESAVTDLSGRGIHVPTDLELARDALIRIGVPPHALLVPDRVHDNTAQEAQTIRELAAARRWRRVIVVSSKYHLRRARLAISRQLRGLDVAVMMRGSRYDRSRPDAWWTSRRDIRWLSSELPRLIAYGLGAGA